VFLTLPEIRLVLDRLAARRLAAHLCITERTAGLVAILVARVGGEVGQRLSLPAPLALLSGSIAAFCCTRRLIHARTCPIRFGDAAGGASRHPPQPYIDILAGQGIICRLGGAFDT
jgi:hypothetical protein